MIEGALLALACHGHSGQHHGLDQRQSADHARNHIPARLEIGVVPGAAHDFDRRGGEGVRTAPGGIELFDDTAQVAERRARGVRVAAVGDDLDVGARSGEQAPLEIRCDLHHEQRAPGIDVAGQIAGAVQIGDAFEDARAIQSRQQLARARAAILIQHGVGHVIEIVGGCVAEYECLHHRGHE